MSVSKNLKDAIAELRKHALGYPDTVEDFPWGHSAFKVKGKIFLSSYLDEKTATLSLSVKLPISGNMALTFPFASPTHYGMGKYGWVTAKFGADDEIPLLMLLEWTDESFRAIAPKRILAKLDAGVTPVKSKRRKKSK